MVPLFLLFSICAALVPLHPDMESLVYQSIEKDKYNEVSCKKPSLKQFVYLWANNPSSCLKSDQNEFVYSSYLAYQEGRRLEILKEFNFSWMNYKRRAWGKDTYEAVKGEGSDEFGKIHHFIYDNLDSLYLMGTESLYEEALEFISSSEFEADFKVRVPHLVQNVLGGLLSAYDLTGKESLLDKAKELGELLLGLYSFRAEQLPYTHYNFATKTPSNEQSYLYTADVLALSEFYRLAALTEDLRYIDLIERITDFISQEQTRTQAILGKISTVEIKNKAARTEGETSFSPVNAPIMHNIFNAWLMSGRNNTRLWDVYQRSKEFILANLTLTTNEGSAFVAERFENGTLNYRMHHAGCGWAGLLARESLLVSYNATEVDLAQKLAETCLNMYLQSPVQLAPEYATFTPEGMKLSEDHGAFRLSGDTIETLLHLWRLTQEHAFKTASLFIFNKIKSSCKTQYGYAGLRNVMEYKTDHIDMPSGFLSKTLKHLFLVFSPVIST
jgi:mannosyl-oligosaccharide alpha-1,2-mannosidase